MSCDSASMGVTPIRAQSSPSGEQDLDPEKPPLGSLSSALNYDNLSGFNAKCTLFHIKFKTRFRHWRPGVPIHLLTGVTLAPLVQQQSIVDEAVTPSWMAGACGDAHQHWNAVRRNNKLYDSEQKKRENKAVALDAKINLAPWPQWRKRTGQNN